MGNFPCFLESWNVATFAHSGYSKMRRRRKIFLFTVIALLALQAAFAGNTVGFDKQKNGFVSGGGGQEQASKKQVESDANGGISEVDAAQRDLESLNNSISNAMYAAEQSKRAETEEQGVFVKVIIATALLGAGIFAFRKFAPQMSFLFNVSDENAQVACDQAEEKSFSEFVTAFKVGPTQARKNSASSASEFVRATTAENSPADSVPLTTFFERAPKECR